MKSKLSKNDENKDDFSYPFIGISRDYNGLIVLFTSVGSGVVLSGNEGNKIGEYSTHWGMQFFDVFYGKIELSN